MLTSLLHETQFRTTVWRHRLTWYWRQEAKDHLPFLAMVGLPILCVASIICFACLQEPEIHAPNLELAQHQAVRAQRRENELQCLAENIYFEARGEPLKGQYAVAEVTLNRTRAPNFPHTVCAVVHEMRWDPNHHRTVADFSWTELGALTPDDGPAWRRAMTVANTVYDDDNDPVVPGALFYHSTTVKPSWARSRTALVTIGNHVFYR